MSKNRTTTFLFAVLCVVTIAAAGFARDGRDKNSADSADSTDSFKKSDVLSKGLSAELAELSFMLGKWRGSVESRRTPMGEFTSGTIEMTVSAILDGSSIETRYSGVVMNGTRVGSGRLSYNPHKKTFQRSWTDSLTSVTLNSEGTFADKQLTMTGSGSMYGISYMFREVTTNLSATSMSWRGEFSLNGGASWFTMVKISVIRAR